MPTYEVRCVACGDLRWPTLPDRPDRYVCARGRAVPAETRVRREVRARKASQTKTQAAALTSPETH